MNTIFDKITELQIETRLESILKYDNPQELSIEWGMNYVLFSPSKRVRPLLLLETNRVFGELNADAYILAACCELIHTYSLVHDDLPCMDDDEYRRGVKTLHTLKNEAYAVLVGDALLTRSYSILSKYSQPDKLSVILKLIGELAGTGGMIQGQYLDMEGENKRLSTEEIYGIYDNKTGALLRLSMLLGAINGGASESDLEVVSSLGNVIGRMFQLQDDILDIVGNSEIIGKPVGSDIKNDKSSLAIKLGVDKARSLLHKMEEDARNLIENFSSDRMFFQDFITFLVTRIK